MHAVLGTMMMFKVRRVPVVSDTGDVEGMISIDDIILRGTPPAGVSQDALIAASRSICGARSAAIHEVVDSRPSFGTLTVRDWPWSGPHRCMRRR